MKSTGVVRNIDELGRIVVPKEVRRKMGINNGDAVEIYVEGDKIILTKYQDCCIFCGGNEDLVECRGKQVCRRCLEEIRG